MLHAPMERFPKTVDFFWAKACGVFAAVLLLTPFFDADYHWHLAVGRFIAENGAVPRQNLFSFTAPDYEFTASGWLFDWLLHHVWVRFHDAGVHLFVAVLAGSVCALCYLNARLLKAERHWALSVSVALALLAHFRFVPRPQVASYLLLSVFVHLLVRAYRGEKWPLGVLPLLTALWANLHAGVVFGLAALWAVAAAWGWARFRKEEVGLKLPGLLACLLLSTGAMFVNPYGGKLFYHGFRHLQEVSTVVLLGEFMVPTWSRFSAFWVLWAVAMPLSLWRAFRKAEPGAFWTVGFGVLAARAVRVVPKFVIVCLPWLAQTMTELEQAFPRKGWKALSVLLPLGVWFVSEPSMAFWLRPRALGVEPTQHPQAMADWVERQQVSGNCFASWEYAGFVEHGLPSSKVFVDPRVPAFPPSLFRELEAAEESEDAFEALMKKYRVEWAFRGNMPLRFSGLGRFSDAHWAVVYWDETGQVMLRREVERFGPLLEKEAFQYFRPGKDVVEQFATLKGEARGRWRQELERQRQQAPREVSSHIGLCLEEARTGAFEQAAFACATARGLFSERERALPDSMQRTRKQLAAAYTYLGDGARQKGLRDAAAPAYRTALEIEPEAIGAQLGLKKLDLLEASPRPNR